MDPLADALFSAQRSGPVKLLKGVIASDGKTVRVGGGALKRYRRVGGTATAGEKVSVLFGGNATPIVFTGVVVVT